MTRFLPPVSLKNCEQSAFPVYIPSVLLYNGSGNRREAFRRQILIGQVDDMNSAAQKNLFRLKTGYLCFLIAAGIATVGLRLYVISTEKMSVLSAVLTAVFLACCAVFSFFFRKKTGGVKMSTPLVTFSNAVVGLLTVTMIVSYFVLKKEADVNAVISIIMLIFSVLSAFYFLLAAASGSFCRKTGMFALFSMSVPLYFAFRSLNDYINVSTLPLHNSGAYHILGMIFAMLFFMAESKRLTGAGGSFLYMTFGGAAFLLLAAYDIPNLVNYVRGLASGGYGAVQSLFSVGVMAYVAVRIATALPAEEEPGPAAPEQTPETTDA